MEKSVSIAPDWLSFTVSEDHFEKIIDRFKDYGLVPKTPRFGYTKAFGVEGAHIAIMFDGAVEGMGVHVQLGGSGLALIAETMRMAEFFEWVALLGAKIARCDAALDIAGYGWTARKFKRMDDNGLLISRLRQRKWMVKYDKEGNEAGTLYLGSRISDAYVRMYDRGAKTGVGDVLRIEIEAKRIKAQMLFDMFRLNEYDRIKALFRSFVEPKQRKGHKRVSERETWAPWVQILGKARAGFLIINIMIKLQKSLMYLRKSTSCIFAMAEKVGLCTEAILHDLLEHGREKMRPVHHRACAEYLHEVAQDIFKVKNRDMILRPC